jgi:hypothetical protein
MGSPCRAVGVVSTIAGNEGVTGSTDGLALDEAKFISMTFMSMDTNSNLFVMDNGAGTVRKVSLAGNV